MSTFQNPPAEYRGKPFWSWNGQLEKSELLRQIDIFQSMGMGGFFCHSRVGLITEYLGEDWFRLINACADKSIEVGMEAWLYDEDRWPSGTAGGLVTEEPDYRMKYIRLEILDGNGYIWDGKGIACFTVDLDHFAFRNKKRLSPGEASNARTVLLFTLEEMAPEGFYNGNTYVDTMNEEAIDRFIELTHQQYAQHCDERLGSSLKGIFTDEPHHGQVMCGFSVQNHDAFYLTPWTKTLFPDFQKTYGVDLTDYLPELFLWKDGIKVHPIKWQYMELLETKFLSVYMKKNQDWCREHNIQLTGHLLHENSLTTQSCMIGSIIRGYEYMDVPGVDVLGGGNGLYWIVKQCASAIRQLGKFQMLSEMYGCTGWGYRFEQHKALGDWQALFGVNQRCHHLSWYSMEGSAKRDYPASINYQSAWHPYYNAVEEYFARIHVFMERGDPVCDLLVINPVESAWVHIYPGWSQALGTADPDVARIENRYYEVFYALCSARLDFDYGDEDFLLRMGSVEEEDGTVYLRVGKARYSRVLVTGMITMRSSTLSLLREFAEKGGKLVFSGDLPSYIDALPAPPMNTLPAAYVPADTAAMLDALSLTPPAYITGPDGCSIDDIYAQARRDGDDLILFLLNMNWGKAYPGCTIQIPVTPGTTFYCEKWDPRTGGRVLLAAGDSIAFSYDFDKDEELLLVVTPQNHALTPVKAKETVLSCLKPSGPFAYTLAEPNVCPLHMVRFRIDGGDWQGPLDVLEADTLIRKAYGISPRDGNEIQPWFLARSVPQPVGRVELEYAFYIENMPAACQLVVERPERYNILINDQPAAEVWEKTSDIWVDAIFSVFNVEPSVWRSGYNTITLACDFAAPINLEALYLLGQFGVKRDNKQVALIALPDRLTAGDITPQGLPFYGAGLTYHLQAPEYESGCRLVACADSMGNAACIKLKGDGGERLLWAPPYSVDITDIVRSGGDLEVQYVLTRANTFELADTTPPIVQGMPGDLSLIITAQKG